jgi:hypothetical protein
LDKYVKEELSHLKIEKLPKPELVVREEPAKIKEGKNYSLISFLN